MGRGRVVVQTVGTSNKTVEERITERVKLNCQCVNVKKLNGREKDSTFDKEITT